MIAVLQRVSEARVVIAGETVGQIGPGLLVLLCAEPNDTEALAQKMLSKILKLRIFGDGAVAGPPQDSLAPPSGGSEPHAVGSVGARSSGKMNLSVQDVGGGLLLVSQFTLAADTRSGNRPGFTGAAAPALGEALFNHFVALARAQHSEVATGRFGADMQVHLVNDGPVTIPLQMNA